MFYQQLLGLNQNNNQIAKEKYELAYNCFKIYEDKNKMKDILWKLNVEQHLKFRNFREFSHIKYKTTVKTCLESSHNLYGFV